MRSPNRFAKIITLSIFIILLGAFVAYRSGYIDPFSQKTSDVPLSVAGNSLLGNQIDTVPKMRIDSTSSKTIMSSSKSMIITEKTLINPENITISDKKQQKELKKQEKKKKKNKDYTLQDIDSTKPTPREMMPSSKSGPIIRPRPDTAKKQQ